MFAAQNVMFLGDFHAGCAYLSRADKKKVRLFTNSKFSWLIGDKVDTTLSDETNCAYDRCVKGSWGQKYGGDQRFSTGGH